MLFDTHAHYDDERFDEDRDTLLASMPENNVGLILNPGCDVESSRKAVSYANKYPFVYAAVGIHPENIEDGWEADLETIRALAQNESKIRAIGEIGLDYYWEKDERARARQQVVFARQMELARALHLPVIVHDRDAHADSMEITRRYPDVIREVPFERLMIETDSPYMAPEPFRGRRNSSLYVHRMAETIAEIKGMSAAEVERITTENGRQLFGISG